ncbi:MAG: DUF4783 domain-containing protein [Ignavibacteriales bacterium]|nr:DUF4783 domain-containing protein [Ignavibacteriales bacterium]
MKTLIPLLVLLVLSEASAQVSSVQQRKMKGDSIVGQTVEPPDYRQVDVKGVFEKLEAGILKSTLTASPAFFASQVYVNITEGESGYFSANQVTSVLQNYFSSRKPVSFSFSRLSDKGSTPYATGRFTFISKGNRESVQIYVSLTMQESKWVVSQFNIY